MSFARPPSQSDLRDPPRADAELHVVLVEPEIPWNAGNAARSCLAAGARLHLVRPLGFSISDRAVRRAGLHYWASVEPVVWPSWEALAERLDGLGDPWLLSARAQRPLWEVSLLGPSVLVFGGESCGLPAAVSDGRADRLVRIGLGGRDDGSLNLSTAVGIGLYEVARQRRSDPGGPARHSGPLTASGRSESPA